MRDASKCLSYLRYGCGGPLCELMAVSPTGRGWVVVALMSHRWVYRCLAEEEVFASLLEAGLEMSWTAVSED